MYNKLAFVVLLCDNLLSICLKLSHHLFSQLLLTEQSMCLSLAQETSSPATALLIPYISAIANSLQSLEILCWLSLLCFWKQDPLWLCEHPFLAQLWNNYSFKTQLNKAFSDFLGHKLLTSFFCYHSTSIIFLHIVLQYIQSSISCTMR